MSGLKISGDSGLRARQSATLRDKKSERGKRALGGEEVQSEIPHHGLISTAAIEPAGISRK